MNCRIGISSSCLSQRQPQVDQDQIQSPEQLSPALLGLLWIGCVELPVPFPAVQGTPWSAFQASRGDQSHSISRLRTHPCYRRPRGDQSHSVSRLRTHPCYRRPRGDQSHSVSRLRTHACYRRHPDGINLTPYPDWGHMHVIEGPGGINLTYGELHACTYITETPPIKP